MERQNPIKNWKYVHNNRRQSGDQLDRSFESSHSNKSGKYIRFQFNKGDQSKQYSSIDDLRKQPIFVFTGKSKEKNHEYSILSKRSAKDKDSDTSKISDNEVILKGFGKQTNRAQVPLLMTNRSANVNISKILKQVKIITEQFKKVVSQFSRRYKEMRYQWDRSFKILLSLQINQENLVFNQLKQQLDKKQEQLDQLSKVSFNKNMFNVATAIKFAEDNRVQNNGNLSLSELAIFKVEPTKEKEILSRKNTIAEFLSYQSISQGKDRLIGREVRSLKQTIKRMHQILQE